MKIVWTLPKPDRTNWHSIVWVGKGSIPFGYEIDKEDSYILLPIVKELEELETAKKLLKEYSSREVADWLSRETGRYISHVGLLKRISIEEKRKRKSSEYRRLAKIAEEAALKAKKIEESLGGSATRDYA